jgi:hypothetical protein
MDLRYDGVVWTGLMWLRIENNNGNTAVKIRVRELVNLITSEQRFYLDFTSQLMWLVARDFYHF